MTATAITGKNPISVSLQTRIRMASVTIIRQPPHQTARKKAAAEETEEAAADKEAKEADTIIKRGFTMRSEEETNRAIERHADTVRRICMIHLKNYEDTQDIFQTVFLKYVLSSVVFESEEHEKAWLIRVTVNACRDLLKSFFRSRTVAIDEALELPAPVQQEHREVLEAVLSLPKKYKDVVYLYYYEEYTAVQIADILGKNVNTVYTLLKRARNLLKDRLGGDSNER